MAEPGEHDQRLDPHRTDGLKAELLVSPPIDLEATLDGGQAFRWWRDGDGYRGVVGRRVYRLSERPAGPEAARGLSAATSPPPGEAHGLVADPDHSSNVVDVESIDGFPVTDIDLAAIQRYLGLDYDFAGFAARFAGDPCIGPALVGFPGLRVLRQDRWECLIAFICSATSNIPRIKRDINAIAAAYGDRIGPGTYDLTFPSSLRLADAGEKPLRDLGLGFHAKYVANAANMAASGVLDLELVAKMSYEPAVAALDSLKGVGRKIADCALAFAFDMPEAFPVDRWVKRALEEWYGVPATYSNEKAAAWARTRFGRDAAYVNQYLFHRQRLTAKPVILPQVG